MSTPTTKPAKQPKQAKLPGFFIIDRNGVPQRPSSWGGGRYLEPANQSHCFRGQAATLRRLERMETLRHKLETSLIREAPQIREMAAAIRHAQPYQVIPRNAEGA